MVDIEAELHKPVPEDLPPDERHRLRWKNGWRRNLRAAWQRFVRHPLEMGFTLLCVTIVRQLSVEGCSDFGGWLGRTFGYPSRRSRVAREALAAIFPDWPDERIESTVRAMWDHLGRVAMEYVRLDGFQGEAGRDRVTITGLERLEALRDDGAPALIVSGHIGHWEMVTLALQRAGVRPLHVVYRPANNRALNGLIRRLQGDSGVELIRKGSTGARRIMAALKGGGHVVMLVDQKMNDGVPLPFFGRSAMTAPAVAQLALRFRCPVVPIRVERVGTWVPRTNTGRQSSSGPGWGPRFRVTVEDPIALPADPGSDPDARQAAVAALMGDINARIEAWIVDRPEQWLWVHKRWSIHPPPPPLGHGADRSAL